MFSKLNLQLVIIGLLVACLVGIAYTVYYQRSYTQSALEMSTSVSLDPFAALGFVDDRTLACHSDAQINWAKDWDLECALMKREKGCTLPMRVVNTLKTKMNESLLKCF